MLEIPTYDVTPPHASYDDDAVRAIGEFFLTCASAEATLTFILNELESYPGSASINGLAVITGMPNKLILEKISVTIAILAPVEHAELDELCTKIRGIFEHRNNIAHSTAITGGGKEIVVVPLKLRPPIKLKRITYSPKQLREYSSKLLNLVRHLSERLRDLGLDYSPEFSEPKYLGQAGQTPQGPQPKP